MRCRLYCKWGHALRGNNLRLTVRKSDRKIVRHCRACAARRTAAWHAKHPHYNAEYYHRRKAEVGA